MALSDPPNNGMDSKSLAAFPTLAEKPVSVMCPDESGDVLQEALAIYSLFLDYNTKYSIDRLSITPATGACATLGIMKGLLKTTDRMHLTSHGSWEEMIGPRVNMYDGYIQKSTVDTWSLTKGACKFIFLDACDSMGHDGINDNALADALRTYTSVQQVVGFKTVVDVASAAALSESFWMFHIEYTSDGGLDTSASYANAKERCQNEVDIINNVIPLAVGIGSMGVGAAVAGLVGLAVGSKGAALISLLLSSIATWAGVQTFTSKLQNAINNFEIDGTAVPSFDWSASSGGSGGVIPPRITPD